MEHETGKRACRNRPHAYFVNLSRAHLAILAGEAQTLGIRRNEFLGLLLRRYALGMEFVRPKMAPSYTFTRDDLSRAQRYVWYVSLQDRRVLDEDRLKMGDLPVASWLAFALNDWIGQRTLV
jgi:hypothetical protein